MRLPNEASSRIRPGRRLYLLLERFDLVKGTNSNTGMSQKSQSQNLSQSKGPASSLGEKARASTITDQILTEKDLRVRYFQLAKERHPDFAPQEQKVIAAKNFVALRNQYDEARQLLRQGIKPIEVQIPDYEEHMKIHRRNNKQQQGSSNSQSLKFRPDKNPQNLMEFSRRGDSTNVFADFEAYQEFDRNVPLYSEKYTNQSDSNSNNGNMYYGAKYYNTATESTYWADIDVGVIKEFTWLDRLKGIFLVTSALAIGSLVWNFGYYRSRALYVLGFIEQREVVIQENQPAWKQWRPPKQGEALLNNNDINASMTSTQTVETESENTNSTVTKSESDSQGTKFGQQKYQYENIGFENKTQTQSPQKSSWYSDRIRRIGEKLSVEGKRRANVVDSRDYRGRANNNLRRVRSAPADTKKNKSQQLDNGQQQNTSNPNNGSEYKDSQQNVSDQIPIRSGSKTPPVRFETQQLSESDIFPNIVGPPPGPFTSETTLTTGTTSTEYQTKTDHDPILSSESDSNTSFRKCASLKPSRVGTKLWGNIEVCRQETDSENNSQNPPRYICETHSTNEESENQQAVYQAYLARRDQQAKLLGHIVRGEKSILTNSNSNSNNVNSTTTSITKLSIGQQLNSINQNLNTKKTITGQTKNLESTRSASTGRRYVEKQPSKFGALGGSNAHAVVQNTG